MHYGAAIKLIRTQRGLTQLELSKRSGVTTQTICRIENNRMHEPTTAVIQKLANALEVPLCILAVLATETSDVLTKYSSDYDQLFPAVAALFRQIFKL